MNTDNTIIRQLEFELVRRPPKCRSLSYPSAHDNIASIKQSRPYLVVAQYSVDLVPSFCVIVIRRCCCCCCCCGFFFL